MTKNRRAKVVYSYAPQNEDELKLDVDEVIEVLDEVEEGWWRGRLKGGQIGVFPSNFVVEMTQSDGQSVDSSKNESSASDNDMSGDHLDGSAPLKRDDSVEMEKKPKPIKGVGFGDIFAGGGKPKLSPIENSGDKNKGNVPKKMPPPAPLDTEPAPKLPPKPMRDQAKVLFSYQAQNDDELSIQEGDIITILSKEIEDQGWWRGELNGAVGVFPDNFVELIKLPVQEDLPPRAKKPERPTEKPPPVSSQLSTQSMKSISQSVPPKLEATKSSNKSFDDMPKSNSGASATTGSITGPAVPGKKPKPPIFHLKNTKPDPVIINTVKPDVVPQENGNKFINDKENANNNASVLENLSMELSTNKLTHLTKNRSNGPSRRPPSTIFKDPSIEIKENGEMTKTELSNSLEQTTKPPQPQTPIPQTPIPQIPIPQTQAPSQEKQTEKVPPWMMELRKAQAKKGGKENIDESTKETIKETIKEPIKPIISPTKVNRFSGDFGNKTIPGPGPLTPHADTNESNPIHILNKPLKLTKPNATTMSTSNPSTTGTSTVTITSPITTPTITSTIPSPSITKPVIVASGGLSAPITKIGDDASSSLTTKEVNELKRELTLLKETIVTRREYEEMSKQVNELKDIVETQKQSYGKVIKDLINDVAEERKKLATLQIEIDRLRKLTTTV